MSNVRAELDRAREVLGSFARIGAACGVSGKAVERWYKRGWLPRTEHTGETRYAQMLAEATDGAVDIKRLMVRPVQGDISANEQSAIGSGMT